MTHTNDSQIRILFLTAEPTDTARLRLGQELREIKQRLQQSQHRERFFLESALSARPGDISQELLNFRPHIVHFSGHGASTGELCFENDRGTVEPISPQALAALFRLVANRVQCVLLNACYSDIQARAIAQHIPFVIGMNTAIGDRGAIAFAIGFYQALAANRSFEEAFGFGRVQMQLEGTSEELTPVLFINASQKPEIDNLKIKIQKKLCFQRRLLGITFSMIILTGGIGFLLKEKFQSWFTPYASEPELFSQGEKFFSLGDETFYRKKGVEAFAKNDYIKATEFFEKSKDIDRNNPEVEIYYNNSLAHERGKKMKVKPITVAVVVPISTRRTSAIAMLRGVALAQNQFNQENEEAGFINRPLNVIIANDSNDSNQAQRVANELIKDQNVLAVIGHNASTASKSALKEYEKNDLAMIAPTSASTELKGDNFFRTILSTEVAAKYLAEYAIKNKIKQVVIFYKEKDSYSEDIRKNFAVFFEDKKKGRKVKSYIKLENSQQNAREEFKSNLFYDNPPDAVVFFPDTELVSTVIDIVSFTRRLRPEFKSNLNLKLLGGATLYTSETLKQAKEGVEGLILTVPWFPEEKNLQKFAKWACDRWEEKIDWATASSYDATQAFIAAISQSKNPSRKDVIENLKSIKLRPDKNSPYKTSGDALQFINGERKDAKPVLVRVVKGRSEECGSMETGGFHFEKVE
ncbi:hypothetical protein A6770_32905 [Nostoc minutum NIES-26]|uniref:ABC transporter substrate-binding protein n=1 Tax=Nostoc minutum NIES-26 TaxID=1844469 RepID=A0A367Q444_9NOSO|nr:hypothetical protein A6770_32905 [Nostoc minutum NIES-26]